MPARLVIGLMSGTSHDGVDAAAARITGTAAGMRARLIAHTYRPYPAALRKRLSDTATLTAADVCELNALVGEALALAALSCAKAAGIDKPDAIASHGQTIWHSPPRGKKYGSTLQIGEPAVIARRTGVPVVSGFRAADMVEGGQGAPLVPYADYLLFKKKAPVVLHNLGGISNLTLVTPEVEGVRAFDTGPANSLMDAAMRRFFGRPFDRAGSRARKGRLDRKLLARMLAHPYFRKRPPKSTGPEVFGAAMLDEVLKGRRKPEDVLCTLAHLSAESIGLAYERFVLPGSGVKEAVFSGGGVRNTFMMGLIRERLAGLRIRTSDELGVPAAAKEALCFAVLGALALEGSPANLLAVTGARARVRLGSITRP